MAQTPQKQRPQQSSSQAQNNLQPPNDHKVSIIIALIGAAAIIISAIIGGVFLLASKINPSPTPIPTTTVSFSLSPTPTRQATVTSTATSFPTTTLTPSERAATINDPWVRAYRFQDGFGTSASTPVAPREIAIFTGGPITFTADNNSYSFPTADNTASILAYVGTQAQGQITETIDNLSPGNTDLTIFNVPQGISLSSAKDVAVQFIWQGMQMKGNCANQQGCTVEYYAMVDARTQVILTTNVSSFPIA